MLTTRLLILALALISVSAWRRRVDPECPPHVIEFSDNCGTPVNAGDFITHMPCYGLRIDSRRLNNKLPTRPMVFNSSNPTGGDSDLGTPNYAFGGPGIGLGGSYGPGSNDMPLGNLLIVSEDNDQADPDDNGRGGEMRFRFTKAVDVESLKVVDNESTEKSWVACFTGHELTKKVYIDRLGDNSVQTLRLECEDTTLLVVHFGGSGGVSHLKFSEHDCKCAPCAGGVTDLKLLYNGEKPRLVTVKQKKDGDVLFHRKVFPGTAFKIHGGLAKGRFGPKLEVFISGYYHTEIQTKCKSRIGVNNVFGDFTILAGHSLNGGRLCRTHQKPPRRRYKRSWCPPVNVDFSEDCGRALKAGDELRDFECLGLRLQSLRRDADGDLASTKAMIFDSSHPTGGDYDLGTPNVVFGGPGIGSGGANPEGLNDKPLNNLLIISEDGDGSDPDDNEHGGLLSLTFDHLVHLKSLKVVDNERDEDSFVACYGPGHTMVAQVAIENFGNNNVQTLNLSECDSVNAILVGLGGSGAISDLVYNDPECECSKCKGGVTDLVLRYNGESKAHIKVKNDNNKVIFRKKVRAGQTFSLSGPIGDKIKIFLNGHYHKTIHTSCKHPIAAGSKFGEFGVVSGVSAEGGNLCVKSYFSPRARLTHKH